MKKLNKMNKGFTLIEILVVIGIIAILAAIVLIAINPARQFQQANDSQRTSNVNAILNAVGQFVADNQGGLPTGIPVGDPAVDANWGDIDIDLGGAGTGDFCDDLVPNYLPAMPVDPNSTAPGTPVDDCVLAGWDSGYEIIQDSTTNRISVRAPGTNIIVTR